MTGLPKSEDIWRAIDTVERCLEDGPCLIHCQAGCDRTGVTLGCLLATRGMPPDVIRHELLSRFPPRRSERLYQELWQPYLELIAQFSRKR